MELNPTVTLSADSQIQQDKSLVKMQDSEMRK